MSKRLHMTVDALDGDSAIAVFEQTAKQYGWRIITLETVKLSEHKRWRVTAIAEKMDAKAQSLG